MRGNCRKISTIISLERVAARKSKHLHMVITTTKKPVTEAPRVSSLKDTISIDINTITPYHNSRSVWSSSKPTSRGVRLSNLTYIRPISNSLISTNKLATWNAQYVNNKSASVCDLVISKHLDIFTVTESWISNGNNTIAEILTTLKDFDYYNDLRINRAGRGTGVLLRKDFKVLRNKSFPFSSMEYIDLHISHSTLTMRLITIYRPPRSKKNRATPIMFFEEFSSLLENLTITPGPLIPNGDFNFHMDSATDHSACTFKDILESAGLRQHVDVPTHRSGHTVDLIIDRNSCDVQSDLAIDRQENCLLKHFETLSDLPSDHYAVICSFQLPRPPATKKTLKYRDYKRIDKQKWIVELE